DGSFGARRGRVQLALGRITENDLAKHVRITKTFRPDPSTRKVYDDRYGEFRMIQKQTAKRRKRRAH
ncbi:MAG TPA: hypothetical protein VNC41_15675, partial [Acidimicrobiia bacterium]|nr:hypothetical protein [Acidimicrobiia bacterium]